MYSYVVFAMTGQGKTKLVTEMLTAQKTINKGCLVFDVNNEYGATKNVTLPNGSTIVVPSLNLSTDTNQVRSRYIGKNPVTNKPDGNYIDKDEFLKIALTKENTYIVFEEATVFFEGKTIEEIRRLLVAKRHKHNVLIFLFHAVDFIPPRMLKMMNFVVLFNTGDTEQDIKSKGGDKLLKYWRVVKQHENQYQLALRNFKQNPNANTEYQLKNAERILKTPLVIPWVKN